MKIEISDTEVRTRNFTSKEGKPLSFREQSAWLHSDDKYPTQFKISLGDQEAYQPGLYTIAPGSIFVDRFGNLAFKRVLSLKKS